MTHKLILSKIQNPNDLETELELSSGDVLSMGESDQGKAMEILLLNTADATLKGKIEAIFNMKIIDEEII